MLKDNLLKVVKKSKHALKIIGSFNATHLALIPNKKKPPFLGLHIDILFQRHLQAHFQDHSR